MWCQRVYELRDVQKDIFALEDVTVRSQESPWCPRGTTSRGPRGSEGHYRSEGRFQKAYEQGCLVRIKRTNVPEDSCLKLVPLGAPHVIKKGPYRAAL